MRVLIVDDSQVARMVLEKTLVDAGYEVEAATNGREALAALRVRPCRLVITDWNMPEMDGVELCRAIRAEDLRAYVYVVLLTNHDAPEQRVAGLTAGADDFVGKPYHAPELLARLGTAERVLALETRDVAIFAMAKMAESRDPETGAHLERVRSYSRLVAQHLAGRGKYRDEVDAEYIRLIYQTSPLHDIGKVGIPDSVLLKPGRLSDREFAIMKEHTTMGAETLAAAVRTFPGVPFLQMARDIAASHHERFDGTGYPEGLAGDRIPLCARIVALADVYDALTSKRVYKEAYTHDVARGILVAEAGKQFDPDLVETFTQAEPQFIAIRRRFAEAPVAAAA